MEWTVTYTPIVYSELSDIEKECYHASLLAILRYMSKALNENDNILPGEPINSGELPELAS